MIIPFRLILGVCRSALRFIDGIVEPPIMRKHVNAGSYRYFDAESDHRDRGGIADIVDGPHPEDGGVG